MPLELESVDVTELFASVAVDTAVLTEGRLVTASSGVFAVTTDRSKTARILLNLVENAAKYAAAGPIELTATNRGDDVCFAVADHGPGIPAEDRERVFERFVQLDQSSTRRQGGTGLGLHLCRQLSELLEGRLSLGETPGGGCTFTLTLPAPAPAVHAPSPRDVPDLVPGCAVRARPADFAIPVSEPAR